MKTLITMIIASIPFVADCQCPAWLNSEPDAIILVTKAEIYLHTTLLREKEYQEGTDIYYWDTNRNYSGNYVSIQPNKKILIKGNKTDIMKMFNEYFLDLPEACIVSKGGMWIKFKTVDILVEDGSPPTRRDKRPQQAFIGITPHNKKY